LHGIENKTNRRENQATEMKNPVAYFAAIPPIPTFLSPLTFMLAIWQSTGNAAVAAA